MFRIIAYDWLTVSRVPSLFASVDLIVGDRVIFFGEVWGVLPAAFRLLETALKGRMAALEGEEPDLDEVLFPCGCTPEQICPRLADFSVKLEGDEAILSDFYYIGHHFPKREIENYIRRADLRVPYVQFAVEIVKFAEQVLNNCATFRQAEEGTYDWEKTYCTKMAFLLNRVKMKLSGYPRLPVASDPVSFLLDGKEDKVLQKIGKEKQTRSEDALTLILELMADPCESRRFLGIRFFQLFRGCLGPLNLKLLEMLPKSTPAIQYAILKTLEEAPYSQITPAILDFFCTQEELAWPIIRDLTGIIAKYLNRRALQEILVTRLMEGEKTPQQRILYLLSQQERTFPVFRRALMYLLREEKTPDAVLRWGAVVLARYPGREVDRVFADLVANTLFSWEIRQQCVRYLPRTKKNIRFLLGYLTEKEVPVRFLSAVIEQLGLIGGGETVLPLLDIITAPEKAVESRRAAIWALFRLLDDSDPGQVYDILGHRINLNALTEGPRVLQGAKEAISALTRMQVQWVMLKLLFNREESEFVRSTIAGCLDRLADGQTVKIMLRLVQDPQEGYLVRANALHALERIMEQGDLAPLPVLQEMRKSFGGIARTSAPVQVFSLDDDFDTMVAFALLLEGVVVRMEQRIGNEENSGN